MESMGKYIDLGPAAGLYYVFRLISAFGGIAMKKEFFRFVLPSMLAFAFSGLYAIVDGFFVGRNVGDLGLAAINIAYPITALIQAAGTGLGMGGAVEITLRRGRREEKEAQACLGNTLTLLAAASLLLTAVLYLCHRPLLVLMGAEGDVLPAAEAYIRIIILGTVFQLFATGCTPLLRNYDASFLAMAAMVMGFVTNIFLDYLLVAVFPLGMEGAALATVIGQAVTVAPCLLFLRREIRRLPRRAFRLAGPLVRKIFQVGVSPFGLTMSPNLVILLMNKFASVYGGETAVAAYAVVSYIICIIQLLLQGVGDGSQPLMSRYLGQNQEGMACRVRNMAYGFAFLTGLVFLGVVTLTRDAIPVMFGSSPETGAMASSLLPFFAFGSLALSFCRVTTSYFYSTHRHVPGYLMVYGEPVLLLALLSLLSPLLGLQGVWIALPAAQYLLFLVSLILLYRNRAGRGEKQPAPLEPFLQELRAWAEQAAPVEGVILVGSHARGTSRADSDVDLVILSTEKENMVENPEFAGRFGTIAQKRTEYYGACTSVRVWYQNGLEVEFGIVEPSWAALPLDSGTRAVLEDGYQVLTDKKGAFRQPGMPPAARPA